MDAIARALGRDVRGVEDERRVTGSGRGRIEGSEISLGGLPSSVSSDHGHGHGLTTWGTYWRISSSVTHDSIRSLLVMISGLVSLLLRESRRRRADS